MDRRTFSRRTFTQVAAAALAAGLAGNKPAVASTDPFEKLRTQPLSIGMLLFPRMDQIDFTGPFCVLSRIPNSTVHVFARDKQPVADHKGLLLTPETSIAGAPPLDLLVVPGGPGQEALMDDEEVLSLIRNHATSGRPLFSVCTGALICGAAGALRGRTATTHWSALELLHNFGATARNERVVIDGNLVSAAGVTAGIDGALTIASLLRGEQVAQQIQLDIQYAPEPPFNAGTPATAPQAVLAKVSDKFKPLTDARRITAERIGKRLGVVNRARQL